MRIQTLLLVGLLGLFAMGSGQAAIPTTIAYQGYLTDSSGQPINQTTPVVFALYDVASGGGALWTESHPMLSVVAGVFTVELGSRTNLPLGLFDRPLYLGVKVGTDPEMQPRLRFSAAPYARTAEGTVACGSGLTNCNGVCALLGDLGNCGSCGTTCGGSNPSCIMGNCGTCAAGLSFCQGECRDFNTSVQHCGSCGVACPQAPICQQASCTSGVCVTTNSPMGTPCGMTGTCNGAGVCQGG